MRFQEAHAEALGGNEIHKEGCPWVRWDPVLGCYVRVCDGEKIAPFSVDDALAEWDARGSRHDGVVKGKPYLLYSISWDLITRQCWPRPGQVYICKVLPMAAAVVGHSGYAVSVMGDGTLEGDTVQMGLFWTRRNAELFAESFCAVAKRAASSVADKATP